jgi:hypothetical protein
MILKNQDFVMFIYIWFSLNCSLFSGIHRPCTASIHIIEAITGSAAGENSRILHSLHRSRLSIWNFISLYSVNKLVSYIFPLSKTISSPLMFMRPGRFA